MVVSESDPGGRGGDHVGELGIGSCAVGDSGNIWAQGDLIIDCSHSLYNLFLSSLTSHCVLHDLFSLFFLLLPADQASELSVALKRSQMELSDALQERERMRREQQTTLV